MTHASLFSGIGGFDLAAEWAGWTNAFNCEIDPFCRKILKYHFPDAEQYGDIRTTDFTIWRDRIDVLTGGFPCQPFSLAGKRKGTEDDRYLWPEMLRVIRTVRPRWVVGENVFGIVNWSEGMVFDKVCSDLEAAGYEVQPYIIPACGVGAPHRRDRCWFVGHLVENPERVRRDGDEPEEESRVGRFGKPCAGDHVRVCGTEGIARNGNKRRIPNWNDFPTQSPVCGRNDGIPGIVDIVTILEGRRARQPYIPYGRWRKESVKGFGNAVVPQVPLQIFETIKKYENLTKPR